jgi:hypothetical protein
MLFNIGEECKIPVGTAVYILEKGLDIQAGVCVGLKFMLGQGYTYYVADTGSMYMTTSFFDNDIGESVFLDYREAKEFKEELENGNTVSD